VNLHKLDEFRPPPRLKPNRSGDRVELGTQFVIIARLHQVRIVAVTNDIFDHWYRETQQKFNFHLSIVFQLLGDMDHAGKLPCYRSPMPSLLPNPVSATAQEAGVSRRPRLSHTCGFLRLHAQVYSKWV